MAPEQDVTPRAHALRMARENLDRAFAVFDAAVALPEAERAAYVASACGDDLHLREEVRSLLAAHNEADGFLSSRPSRDGDSGPAAALMGAAEDAAAFIGREFGAYTIVGLLGSGGMGRVYRARDRQLDRDVAIKILPPLFIKDTDRLARFEREARILAALNHQHIGAIYGLERVDGMPALVLELLEGPTLAERLLQGPLPVKSAVAIAMQIADALEVAHRQGIIHRDLKPANVKVTTPGFVKLLDFGLAKGVDHQDTGSASSTVAVSPTTSRPGAVMGTAAYMSPEQARGEPVDGRSDLFSLGAVLYEMVTGRPAFSGDTSSAILRAILNDTPPSPRALDPRVPAALESVVMRLLAKDRGARPQQASAVRSEFQRLASELDGGSSHWLRRWRRSGAAAAAVILVGLAIWTARRPAPGALVEREYTQITHFADSVTSPAVSSDGRLLTFIRGASTFHGPGEIYVKALPDGEPRRLTSDGLDKMDPVFSPDNSTIAYTTVTTQFVWDTWTVPVGGGEAPRRWVQNASGLSWLRDGRLMFSEQTGGLHMKVTTADEQRNAARVLYSPAGEYGMAHRSTVSPNGEWVLVAEMDNPVWQPCRLVPSTGQDVGRRVGPDGQCTSAAWSHDGQWMYFASNSTGAFHLWRQRFPNGVPEQLTHGPTEEEGIAPDPDGRSVLTSVGTRHQSTWVHDEGGERAISREGYAFVPTSPNGGTSQPLPGDGRSVFYLVRQGAVRFSGGEDRVGELWATDLATGRHRSILQGRQVIGYDVSRDGRQLVFAELDERGTSHVWLARLDRPDKPRRLAELEADSPRFSATGDIFCRGIENGTRFVYRLREDRAPEKAVQQPVLFFQTTSPDGTWLIVRVQLDDRQDGQVTMAFPTAGGPPVPLCAICEVDWMPNGRSLVIRFPSSDPAAPGRTFMVTLESGATLPRWPAQGIRSRDDLNQLRIAREVEGWIYPSDTGSTYVFARSTTQRNIHRVPLP